jgi:hypothetical protein
MRRFLFCVLLALPACGSDSDEFVYSLDTCGTGGSGEPVPLFYDMYFRCTMVNGTETSAQITSTALPPHLSAYYGADSPNYTRFDTDRGPEYMQNPNLLAERPFTLDIPHDPVAKGITITADRVDGMANTDADEYPLGPVGMALDSVALFNAVAAPGDDIDFERFTFDTYEGHPAPDGTYHYHSASPGPLEVLATGPLYQGVPEFAEGVELYGIMCDGTLVFGCTEIDGTTPTGPFDAQGGHVHSIIDASVSPPVPHFTDRYHTHVCPAIGGHDYTPEIQYYSTCIR